MLCEPTHFVNVILKPKITELSGVANPCMHMASCLTMFWQKTKLRWPSPIRKKRPVKFFSCWIHCARVPFNPIHHDIINIIVRQKFCHKAFCLHRCTASLTNHPVLFLFVYSWLSTCLFWCIVVLVFIGGVINLFTFKKLFL